MPKIPPGPCRRFAPLNPDKGNPFNAPRLAGIVFDVDGTLCLPQNHMFATMRSTLQIRKPTDILAHITTLPLSPPLPPTPASPLNHRPTALAAIRAIERETMTTQTPQPGLRELMTYLESRGVKKGLCTRNFPAPVQHLQEKFLEGIRFGPVITRETTGVRMKPSPEGVVRCAEVWAREEERTEKKSESGSRQSGADSTTIAAAKTSASEKATAAPSSTASTLPGHPAIDTDTNIDIIMVGDSLDDMAAGHHAGAATILLASEETEPELLDTPGGHEFVDRVVWSLGEIVGLLEEGFMGKEGVRR